MEAAQKEGEAWSMPRKAGYARQMLALLRTLHETCKVVFVDVKPGMYGILPRKRLGARAHGGRGARAAYIYINIYIIYSYI